MNRGYRLRNGLTLLTVILFAVALYMVYQVARTVTIPEAV